MALLISVMKPHNSLQSGQSVEENLHKRGVWLVESLLQLDGISVMIGLIKMLTNNYKSLKQYLLRGGALEEHLGNYPVSMMHSTQP